MLTSLNGKSGRSDKGIVLLLESNQGKQGRVPRLEPGNRFLPKNVPGTALSLRLIIAPKFCGQVNPNVAHPVTP